MLEKINEAAKQKGRSFQNLFYLLLVIYVTPLLVTAFYSLLKLSILEGLFSLSLTLIIFYLLKKRNFYAIFLIFTFSFPFYILAFSPLVYIFLPVPTILVYFFIAIMSLIFGILYSSLFNEIGESSLKFIIPSILVSVFESFGFAVVQTIIKTNRVILEGLEESLSMLSTGAFPILTGSKPPIFNVLIGFVLFMIFFNAPFIRHFLLRGDRNNKYLALYVVPFITFILIYILLNVLFVSMIENIMLP